jgi:uncharacterized membrane protein
MNILEENNYHDHSKDTPNKWIVIIILLLSLVGIIYSFSKSTGGGVLGGIVQEIKSEQDITLEIGGKTKIVKEQTLSILIEEGKESRNVEIINDYKPVAKGDKIFVRGSLFGDSEFTMVDISRTTALIFLFMFFVVLVIVVGGWKGIYSLIGLIFTFAVIFVFLVPQILAGAPPVWIGVASATIILLPTLYLSYGLNKKSIAAFLGIILSLFLVGLVANYFVEVLKFTGLSEASMYLDMETAGPINLLGLMVAGIIIAAVGVLDDVAVIQSSVVFSLSRANSEFRGAKLFREAMRVGKDHISAVVNTLVLAYTGASLPLILLLSLQNMSPGYFASTEVVAEEILRTLVSSSGLLLAVPLTTIIAVFVVDRFNKNSK